MDPHSPLQPVWPPILPQQRWRLSWVDGKGDAKFEWGSTEPPALVAMMLMVTSNHFPSQNLTGAGTAAPKVGGSLGWGTKTRPTGSHLSRGSHRSPACGGKAAKEGCSADDANVGWKGGKAANSRG